MTNLVFTFTAETYNGLFAGQFSALDPYHVWNMAPTDAAVGSPWSGGYSLDAATDALYATETSVDEQGDHWDTPVMIGSLGLDLQPTHGFVVAAGQGWLVNPAGEGSTVPQFYRIDLANGHAQYVGEVGMDLAVVINGLAIAPIPEPSPLALLLCAVALVLWRKVTR